MLTGPVEILRLEHDLVIIGGGVAGYVAAIKAGQEGLKVRHWNISESSISAGYKLAGIGFANVFSDSRRVDRMYREAW